MINGLDVPQSSVDFPSPESGQMSNEDGPSNGNVVTVRYSEEYNNGASTSRG